MKKCSQNLKQSAFCSLALASMFATTHLRAAPGDGQDQQPGAATVAVGGGGSGAAAAVVGESLDPNAVVLSSIEPAADTEKGADKDRAWLGVSIEEGSEALASQLGLPAGSGLVVTYVAPDSPAAKAGLQKNDVLVKLDGQLLVVPAQLRKLIEVRKAGDEVKLVFYRTGKEQDSSATLAKAPDRSSFFGEGHAWDGEPGTWLSPFKSDAFRHQIKVFRDSMGNVKIDTAKVQEEVRHSLEQARKAMQEALHASSNAVSGSAAQALRQLERELQRSRIDVDNNASVTVRSTNHRVRSIVKADDAGTIVIVCNPKPRLTAHDKEGKLLFDGQIDTAEQRGKVPPELWQKVEPLLDKIAPKAEDDPQGDAAPSGETSLFSAPAPVIPGFQSADL